MLLTVYGKGRIQKAINTFSHHRVMVSARQNMDVILEYLGSLSKDAHKFAILVHNNSMGESKA